MDNLINSITSTSDSGITLTLSMAIVAMAAALIFGLVISLTYMGTHKNKYQQNFAITLTMLPIILTVFSCGNIVNYSFPFGTRRSGGYRIYFF